MTNTAIDDIRDGELSFHRVFSAGTFQRVQLPAGSRNVTPQSFAFLHCGPIDVCFKATPSAEKPDPGDPLHGPRFCVVAAEQSLHLTYPVPFQADIFQISPDFIKAVSGRNTPHVEPASATVLPPLQSRIWQRLVAAAKHYEDGADHIVSVCTELLLLDVVENASQSSEFEVDRAVAGANYDALVRAIAFIDANLGQKIDVGVIAKTVDLSPFYFSRLFRAACGVSVYGFVIQKRLQVARLLLETTDLPLSTIALETGFSSQSHFTTSFRERYGVTPGIHRHNTRT